MAATCRSWLVHQAAAWSSRATGWKRYPSATGVDRLCQPVRSRERNAVLLDEPTAGVVGGQLAGGGGFEDGHVGVVQLNALQTS